MISITSPSVAPQTGLATSATVYDVEQRVRATYDGHSLYLPRFAAKVRNGQPVNVIAIGSSSLTPTGSSSAATAFWPQFTANLQAAYPNVSFNFTNNGVGGYIIRDLENNYGTYTAQSPDLTIVVIGVNDANGNNPVLSEFVLRYESLVRSLARYGSDVICVDGQMFQAESSNNLYYNAAIRDAATSAGVAFFSRNDMMHQEINSGQFALTDLKAVNGTDLHDNDTGYYQWAKRMAGAVINSVRLHGSPIKAVQTEFSIDMPVYTVPSVAHTMIRSSSAPFETLYDTWTYNGAVVTSCLFRGRGIRIPLFVGTQQSPITKLRYRLDESATWTTLPLPVPGSGAGIRGGAWTLARGLVDTLHLAELEITGNGSAASYFSGWEVLTHPFDDTYAVGGSLAQGGRAIVVSGCNVVPTAAMSLAIYPGTILLQGRETKLLGDGPVTLAGGDPTNPRLDLIVSTYNGTRVIQGTPANPPVIPAMPHEAVMLASVLVPAGATSVGTVTDLRTLPSRRSPVMTANVPFPATAANAQSAPVKLAFPGATSANLVALNVLSLPVGASVFAFANDDGTISYILNNSSSTAMSAQTIPVRVSLNAAGTVVTAAATIAAPVVVGAPAVGDVIRINTYVGQTASPTGATAAANWNNLDGAKYNTSINANAGASLTLINSTGASTALAAHIVDTSVSGNGGGFTSGNNSGAVPDDVLQCSIIADLANSVNNGASNNIALVVAGVASGTTWQVQVVGSRATASRLENISVNGGTVQSPNIGNNTGISATFTGVTSSSGNITVNVSQNGSENYCYLNAVILTRTA